MRRCPACNFEIENDKAKFCKKCGAKLPGPVSSKAEAPKPVVTPKAEAPKPAQAPKVEEPKPIHIAETPKPSVEKPVRVERPYERKKKPVEADIPRGVPGVTVPPPIPKHVYRPVPAKTVERKKQNPIAVCFGKYATFTGRATRSEYWWFNIFNLLVFLAFYIPAIIIDQSPASDILAGLGLIYWLIVWCPQFAVMVRRLHDVGKSGWFWMVSFIPLVGGFILLYFFCKKGDNGVNAYGPPE